MPWRAVNLRRATLIATAVVMASGLVGSATSPQPSRAAGLRSHVAATMSAAAASPTAPTSTEVIANTAAPCTRASTPPAASRLAAPAEYTQIQVKLAMVGSTTQPRVSANDAYARMTDYKSDSAGCGITETLALWSSATPATMPADCVPPAIHATPWAAPASCQLTPLYTDVLAWVFTWRTDCLSSGGAYLAGSTPRAMPTSQRFACTAMAYVDATTGSLSDLIIGTSSSDSPDGG